MNYVSLVNMDELKSSAILLAAVSGESIKLIRPPTFPGKIADESLLSNGLSTQINKENSLSNDLLNSLPRVKDEQCRSGQEKSTEEITTKTELTSLPSREGLEVFFFLFSSRQSNER